MVFPTFFNLSLNLAIRGLWSEPQPAPSLVFADCIELLHLWLQRISSIWFQCWPSGDVRHTNLDTHKSWSIFHNLVDCSMPDSSVHGILWGRILEWVAISFSSAWKWKMKVKSLSPTFSDPMVSSPPGSSFHGIFQARVLEWGAFAFSKPSV